MGQGKIVATAPGKIILFGEHSVVYGHPALAVPVMQVRATCQIEPNLSETGITITASNLNKRYHLQQAPTNDPLATVVKQTLTALAIETSVNLKLTVFSNIPIACGLGSGAAVSTAIVRALSQYFKRPFSPQDISDIVFNIEKLHHGTPSGIDNTVVAFAQPIFFRKGQPIEHFSVGVPLTLIIADTGVKSETYKVVGDLRKRWQADPDTYEQYFNKMGDIAIRARQAIEAGDIPQIGQCMNQNHRILDDLNISHPTLNSLVEAALSTGAVGAKLSGAGWGGNMIALAPSEYAHLVAQALQDAGAVNTIATTLF